MRMSLSSVSEGATSAGPEGNRIGLTQSLDDAESGAQVNLTMDIYLGDIDPEGEVAFEIGRGHLGSTTVQILVHHGTDLLEAGNFTWAGVNPGEENVSKVSVPSPALLDG